VQHQLGASDALGIRLCALRRMVRKVPKTPFRNPYTGASAGSVSGSLQNGSIESDAAVQPPLGSQECLAASLPIEFLEFIVPDPLHEADQRN
jgi:hypothetical protein